MICFTFPIKKLPLIKPWTYHGQCLWLIFLFRPTISFISHNLLNKYLSTNHTIIIINCFPVLWVGIPSITISGILLSTEVFNYYWKRLSTKMLRIAIILSQISLLCHTCLCQSDSLVVNTNSGLVRGKRFEQKSKFNQRPINAFIGIPYARPPVGQNRFRVVNYLIFPIINPNLFLQLVAPTRRDLVRGEGCDQQSCDVSASVSTIQLPTQWSDKRRRGLSLSKCFRSNFDSKSNMNDNCLIHSLN